MGRVNGKIALVTGAASGLGLADAKTLAREGATVIVTDVNDELGANAAEEIGHGAEYHHLDVSDEAAWVSMAKRIEDKFSKLDVLVNNAGIVIPASPTDCTLEQFRLTNAIMNEGVFLGIKYMLPLLAKSGGGSIINMSSTASHLGYPPFFAYSAAKGAVRSMSKSVSVHCQLEKLPVRSNSIHAGAIETPMVQNVQGRGDEAPVDVPDGILPADSLGSPQDVANLVLFLASDESRFITGGEYLVDNGLVSRPADLPME
ncbi:MAG: SDR family oxidoreductase [Parvibaculales bacterium]